MPFDLVQEMDWESETDFLTLEDAGLEESGNFDAADCTDMVTFIKYMSDGFDSRYEDN